MDPKAAASKTVDTESEQKRNLYCASWEEMEWDNANTPHSLERIRKILEADAENAIKWYYTNKRKNVWYSQALRLGAVILGGIGAVIPFVATTLAVKAPGADTQLEMLKINQWGYVFLVAAGTCVAVDKLFGFSSCWLRFVEAAMRLQTLLGKFRVEWYRQMVLADLGGPTPEAVSKQFDTLLDFTGRIREVIERETGDWITEFRSNLTKLSEDTKAMQEAREKQIQGQVDQVRQLAKEREHKSGAIVVTIKNFAALGAGFTWSLELDNEPRKANIERAQFIVKGLDPGTCLVSARGTSNNKVVQAAQNVTVDTGKSASAALELQ
jgi:hypothetical protein